MEVLERISSQLSLLSGSDAPFISTNPAGALPPFQATKTAVAINAVWFLSLTFALLAALFAILMQQWLRQYANLPQVTGRSRAHIRQRRYLALHDWLVPQLISGLSVLLQTTLFLFLGGLLAFLWTINPSVAVVITAAVATFFMAFALTTILPAMLVECPYRSPLAWVFYIASKPIAHSTAQRLYSSVHWLLWHLSDHIPRRAPIRPFLETFRFHILVRLRTTDIAPSSWYDREAQAMASPDFERDLSAVLWASRTHSSSQVEWIAHCLLDSMNPSTALFFWIARTARPQATYTQVLVAAKSTYALSYARGNWLHKDEDREVARALLEHACRYLLSESPSVPDINEAALLNMIPYLAPVHSPPHVKDYLLSVSERPDFQSSAENMSSLALQILEQHRSVSDPQTQLVQDGMHT